MSKINELFNKELKVINVGIESFYKDLKDQNIKTIHVDWKPSAGGNKKLSSLLSRLK